MKSMRYNGLRVGFAVMGLLVATTAWANSPFPASITEDGETLKKVGEGTMSFLWQDVYDIALWAPDGSYRDDALHVIEIKYDFSFTQEELTDETIKQMRKFGPVSEQTETGWRRELANVYPDLKEGDTIRAVTIPRRKVVFYHNGKPSGVIVGQEFSQKFSRIWLDDKSDDPDLTQQLKGKKPQ